jgi:taurine transport system substrate-binding protein
MNRPPSSPDGPTTLAPPLQRVRSRSRRCGTALFAAVAGIAMTTAALAPPASAQPTLTVGYFTGLIAEPETVIGSTPSLANDVPAHIKWVPITAGVTGLAEVSAGALDVVAGVGNPPTVAAISNGTNVDVVWDQSLDSDSLIVPKSVTSPDQLIGKTIGDLEGSSEDYEVHGWLSSEHLTGKVTIVGFQSEQAAAAAWLAGKITAAYVQGVLEITLTEHGGAPLTNAKKIAALGYPGLNVLAVTHKLVVSDPSLVQAYVCTELKATNDLLGPDQDTYFRSSAGLLGVAPNQAVQATKEYISYYFSPGQEKTELEGANGAIASGPTVQAYIKTATFDKAQGRITSVPSAATLASHVDPTFAVNALAGHCS